MDRRDFLLTTAAGVAITALPRAAAAAPKSGDDAPVTLPPIDHPSEAPKPPSPSIAPPGERVGFALVGIGHLALEQLLPGFAQAHHAKLTAIVSGDPAKAKRVAAQHGVSPDRIYDYKTYDRMKDAPDIDAVYIALPNDMHAEYTARAAQAGKHVLCEKPMATTSADAAKMIDACKAAGKKLMIAYRIQYEPRNRFAMQLARDKKYGRVKMIEGHNGQNQGDPKQWRQRKAAAGSGSLFDVGIYCLNTTRFVLGEEPEWVSAAMYSTPNDARFKEIEENVVFQLSFPSGALASLSCSYGTHRSQRYRCLADNGGWFGLDPAFAYDNLRVEIDAVREGKTVREAPGFPPGNQFSAEMDHFAACIRADRTPYTPGEEGLQDMKLLEAILQAAREGKRVTLPRVTTLDTFRGPPPTAT